MLSEFASPVPAAPGYFLPLPRQSPIPSLLRLATLRNHPVGAPVMPGFRAERGETPRRHRMISLYAAFAAAVRMVHRIHGHAAHGRPFAVPARPAGLAVRHVFMIEIAHLADGGHAVDREPAHFPRRELYQR